MTAAVAFAVAVAVFTVPDLIAGESVVSERPTTFFSSGDGGDGSAAPAGETQKKDRTAPEDAGTTATTATAPEAPATTAPAPAPPAPTTTTPAPAGG